MYTTPVAVEIGEHQTHHKGGGTYRHVTFTFPNGVSTSGSYVFIAKDLSLGTTVDQHEVLGSASVPVADYWRVNGDLTWNLATNSWLRADTGVTYDDGYLVLGAGANFTPSSWGYGFTFKLKGPDGALAF